MRLQRVVLLLVLFTLPACVVTDRTGERVEFSQPQPENPLLTAYARALDAYLKDPRNEDNIIWLGRREAYLEQMRDAIATYTRGLELYPDSARLLRHRGHRYISTRQFDLAIADLSRAAMLVRDLPIEIEPDGMPNPADVPRSNLQFNIHYHLGLAHYCKGDMQAALAAYEDSMRASVNDDLKCATTHWMYMTLRRLNRHDEATQLAAGFPANPEILENDGYHALIQLYRGERGVDAMLAALNTASLSAEDVTVGYGLVNWLLLEGRAADAAALREAILRSPHIYAFGFIAAQTDSRFQR